jgi:hypothetical protein
MRGFRTGSLWAGSMVVLASTIGPVPCPAAEPTKTELAAARDLFARAEKDEDAGHWSDALDKLRRASSVKMTPGIRFHVALCEEKLGQLVAALGDYTAAEAAARSEGNKEVLEVIADPLAALRTRIPNLTITSPEGVKSVEVTLDGGPLVAGLLGTPVPVEVGAHTVAAHAPGRLPFSTTVTVAEHQTLTVEIRLPAPTPVVPAASGALAGARAPESAAASAPLKGDGTQRSSAFKTDALLTTVGAAAIVGFGFGAYFVAGGKQSSAESQCLTMPSCDNLKGGVQTWDALALSAWIVGAGLGAVSLYLWTRPGKTPSAPAKGELRVGPGSVGFAGVF